MFNYDEFTTRNLGFISEKEQETLKGATVFMAGVGGMGGTAIACLARTGISHFIFADIDTFEISNLNRQIFSFTDTIDLEKAKVTENFLKKINPDIKTTVYKDEWVEKLDEILPKVTVVINGCDDPIATVTLLRKAKEHGKIVIDAFASTLPSVYVVKPTDPRPEVTFSYPSVNRDLNSLSEEEISEIGFQEIVYVMTNSSSAKHVILDIAAEMVNGKRKRISFAPMVWMTGCLMSYETVKVILNRKTLASHRGVFINPWTFKIEKPLPRVIAYFKRFLVVWYLKRLMS